MKNAAATLLTGFLCLTPAWAQSLYPRPNEVITVRRPDVGANFGGLTPVHNMELYIDGRNWSVEAVRNGNDIHLTPSFDFDYGLHRVEARAINVLGAPLRHSWSFTIANPNPQNPPPQPPQGQTRLSPKQNDVVQETRPRISADFPENLRNGRLYVDGNDVTGQVSLSGDRLTYVPTQDLAPGRHQVSAQATSVSGQNYNSSWSFEVRPAQAPPSTTFSNLTPPPNQRVNSLRPFISADFPPGLDYLRVLVDNRDVTNEAQRNANRISWSPNYDLQPGAHGARVEGRSSNGQVVHADWNFTLEASSGPASNPNVDPNDATIDFGVEDPITGDRVRSSFNVTGNAPAGRTVRVVVKPLPKKNKVSQFQAVADGQGYFSVPVSPTWATKGMRLEVTVTVLGQRGRPATEPIVLEVYRR